MTARNDNIFITRGIIYGTKARPISDPKTDASHEWKIYLYSPFNTSMNYIDNVTFTLHETFQNNVIVKKYPFELTEQGWGEFSIQIKINFKDPNEKPVVFFHNLMLHDGFEQDGYIVNEKYDEIVFRSPTVQFMHLLEEIETKPAEFLKEEKEELDVIEKAIKEIMKKIEDI